MKFSNFAQVPLIDSDRDRCAQGTCKAILDEIDSWICNPKKPQVYWLKGLAGTGKTTIAQTIVDRLQERGRLGAFFFCSRDSVENSNPNLIVPSLANGLAWRHRDVVERYVPVVLSNPEILKSHPREQLETLVIKPLSNIALSTVIVIDGLDECRNQKTVSDILSALGESLSRIPNVKFLITSRPKRHIQESLPDSSKVTVALHKVQAQDDIRLFFKHAFKGIERKLRRPSGGYDSWQDEEKMGQLCKHAAGWFVYAKAVVEFIKSDDYFPDELAEVLESPESSVLLSQKNSDGLSSLYTSALQDAFGDYKPEDVQKVRSVLGAVGLATKPLSPSAIAMLLQFDVGHVLLCLEQLEPLLTPRESNNCPVQLFHRTFFAFLTDPETCTDQRFHIIRPQHHRELLFGCLKLMNGKPEASEPGYDECIIEALEYARMSWLEHLAGTDPKRRDDVEEIIEHLNSFLKKRAYPLSAEAGRTLMGWLDKVSSVLHPKNTQPVFT